MEEFQVLEQLFTNHLQQNNNFLLMQPLNFFRLHQSLRTRISEYVARSENTEQDVKLLQHLYTASLSKTCRLNATDHYCLIINIKEVKALLKIMIEAARIIDKKIGGIQIVVAK